MRRLLKTALALALSAPIVMNAGDASEVSTIYINKYQEDDLASNRIKGIYNGMADEDSMTYVSSSSESALVDSLPATVLVAENNGKHLFVEAEECISKIGLSGDIRAIGGPNSVSYEAGDEEINFARIAGEDRYDTAVKVAEELGTERDLIICNGEQYTDVLSASSLASLEDRNILLVASDDIPINTARYLREYGRDKDILIAGGEKSVSEELVGQIKRLSRSDKVQRIAGSNRFETSKLLAEAFDGAQGAVVVEGELNEKAFSASILAAKLAYPLYLVDGSAELNIGDYVKEGNTEIFLLTDADVTVGDYNTDGVTILDLERNPTSLPEKVEEVEIEVEVSPEPSPEPVAEEPAEQESAYKQTGAEAEAKEWIAQRESNGSYTAYNPNGGYYGRYQLNPSLIHYGASPAEQEAAADAYVYGRYGSWTAAKSFWMANGWY